MHRLLIIGVGSIGERHLRCSQRTQRVTTSICELNDDLRQTVAQRYNVQQVYKTLDEALAGEHDAAVICTPAHLHIPMATALAQRGVHLLIEKPLSTTPEGIDALRREIQQRELVASVAYVFRVMPGILALRSVLAEQRFGRPVQLIAVAGQHFPTYRPAYRHIYYKDRATGGGAVQDALPHVLNAGQWLLGPIDALAADIAHQVLEGVQVEDTVHVIARQGSAMSCYSLNQYQAPNEITLTIVCERGTVRFESHRQTWMWMTESGGAWQEEPLPQLERDDLFVRQAHAFLDALEGKAQPLCTLDEAEQTLQTALTILAAAQRRQWRSVSVPATPVYTASPSTSA